MQDNQLSAQHGSCCCLMRQVVPAHLLLIRSHRQSEHSIHEYAWHNVSAAANIISCTACDMSLSTSSKGHSVSLASQQAVKKEGLKHKLCCSGPTIE